MEPPNKKACQVEPHQLDLRYAHTRIIKERDLFRMKDSLQRYGQINPVVVIPGGEGLFVLIDGYKRVKALKEVFWDTVWAEVWEMGEEKALLSILADTHARRWEVIEQAALIRELCRNHDYSLGAIAREIGRDKSWVKRKLDLLESLPEDILEAVISGHISAWVASRVLVPLARANPDHAGRLTESLKSEPLSTRDLTAFYEHYKGANRQVKEKMISAPYLFLKARKTKQEEAEGLSIGGGPERAFGQDLIMVVQILKRLLKRFPQAIYPGLDQVDRQGISVSLNQAENLLARIINQAKEKGVL